MSLLLFFVSQFFVSPDIVPDPNQHVSAFIAPVVGNPFDYVSTLVTPVVVGNPFHHLSAFISHVVVGNPLGVTRWGGRGRIPLLIQCVQIKYCKKLDSRVLSSRIHVKEKGRGSVLKCIVYFGLNWV